MPKKKLRRLYLLFSIALSIAILAAVPHFIVIDGLLPMKRRQIQAMPTADYFQISTLSDLCERSDYIVSGYVENRTVKMISNLKKLTITDLHIEEVFKGGVKTGEIIKLREPYYVSRDGDMYIINYLGNYSPTLSKQKYIFFLRFYDNSNTFSPIAYEYGRYPVLDETKMVTIDGEFIGSEPTQQTEKYNSIYQEVDKFLRNKETPHDLFR